MGLWCLGCGVWGVGCGGVGAGSEVGTSQVLCMTIVLVPPMKISDVYCRWGSGFRGSGIGFRFFVS